MRHVTDMLGLSFGSWVVERELDRRGKHRVLECRCLLCGGLFPVYHTHLTRGKTRACFTCSRNTHGHYSDGRASPTVKSWEGMKDRCVNPSNQAYPYYGGRGLGFDPRWADFGAFLSDMGVRPEGCTLDRVDSDKGYCKDNCRWATPEEQQNNKRTNVRVEFNGRTLTLAQWTRELGIARAALYSRYYRGRRGADLFAATGG